MVTVLPSRSMTTAGSGQGTEPAQANPLARRVIFITGDTVAPETRRFLQGVDNAVLSKPFRLRDVRESVRAALSR